jgi:tetratricopeptide (TPR) repeat protein
MVALEQGCLGEALQCFEECLEINTRNNFAHYQSTDLRNIGMVYMNLHQFERALTVMETAAELRKQLDEVDTLLLSQLALCRMILGDDTMLQELRRVMLLHHRDVYTQFLVRLTLIDGHLWQRDLPMARQLIDTFLSEVKDTNPLLHARALLRLGRVKLYMGEADAAQTLQQAVALEKEWGGREVWLGGVWMTEAGLPEGDIVAADKIAEIGLGLAFKPDLRYAFLHAPTVEMVMHRTEKTE